jgi:hypothetical protein
MGKYQFTVEGTNTFLNGKPFLARGLRCSNALYSEKSADELLYNLKLYTEYGLNTISVFFMGNRFGDIKGYNEDASLNEVYASRMEKIIRACDELGILVLAGCLYWGESRAKWLNWTQQDAERAVENTVRWAKNNDFTNIYFDVDNEGMGKAQAGFDIRSLILAAKKICPEYVVASNYTGPAPEEADICIHHSYFAGNKPYIESEGTPENAPGAYWGRFSRQPSGTSNYGNSSYNNYINIGLYTEEMKANQIQRTDWHFAKGYGYMLASTWLQAAEPFGPNHAPGGNGTPGNPGILWWMEYIRHKFGVYRG